MATAATIWAKLNLDDKGFSQGLKNAEGKVQGFGKSFGGITSAMQGAGKVAMVGLIGGAAAAATAVAGVTAALAAITVQAAPVESLQTAFYSLSEAAGTTGDDMLAAMQKGSGGMISARDLMTQFNMASSLVSDEFAKELPTAMELVSKAAAGTGQDMGFLMDSLVKGVGRVSPMILDNLGVQVDLTEACEAYATANGLVASELTKTEQQMAVQELVMAKLEEKYGDMESVYDTSAAKMAAFKASIQDTKDQIGMAFLPTLSNVMTVLSEVAQAVLPAVTGALEKVAPFVEWVSENFLIFIRNVMDGMSPIEAFKLVINDFFKPEISERINGFIDSVVDFIAKAREAIQPIIDWITNNIELKDVLATLGILISTVIVPALVSFIGSVISTTAPIVAAFAGVMAVVVLLRKAWESDFLGMRTALTEFWDNKVKPAFEVLKEWLSVNIPLAIAVVKEWWENQFVPALQAVWEFIQTNIIPIFETVVLWLQTNIPIAIQAVSDFWNNTLKPALEAVWSFIQENVIPIFQSVAAFMSGLFTSSTSGLSDLWTNKLQPALQAVWLFIQEHVLPLFQAISTFISTVFSVAITALAGFWQNVLQPALNSVWSFLQDHIFPLFQAVADFMSAAFSLAITALAGLWENVLQPAIEAVWEWLKEKLQPVVEAIKDFFDDKLGPAIQDVAGWFTETLVPAIKTIIEWIGDKLQPVVDALKGAFDKVGEAIDSVTGWMEGLTEKIKKFKLPDWLTPGSPTPFEMGLWGISDAMKKLARQKMPDYFTNGITSDIGMDLKNPAYSRGQAIENHYNLTMQTSNSPEDVIMAFDLLKAYGGV